jgi:outer membrane receptor protein involved in Fe transport
VSAGAGHEDQWKPDGPIPTQANLHAAEHVETNIDAVAQLTPKAELRVEGSWSNLLQDTLSGTSYAINKNISKSIKATLTAETAIGVVQASGYQNDLAATYDLSGPITWKNTITVAAIQDLFKLGTNNTFRIGGEYRHNQINTAAISGGEVFYDDWSGSGMWNWGISPHLTSTLAVRVDDLQLGRSGTFPAGAPMSLNSNWNRTVVSDSENYTLAWRPTDVDTVRGSFGRGVQAPTLIDLSIQFQIGPGLFYGGNPNLKPSRVDNFELAYDHSFSLAKLGVRAFYQIWKDLKNETGVHTDLVSGPYASALIPANVANSKEAGLEFTGSTQIRKNLSLHADVTFTHAQDKSIAQGVDPLSLGVAFRSTTPAARGNVGLTWTPGQWEVDTNVHYVSDYKYFNASNVLSPIDAFAAVSARVGYKFKNGVIMGVSGQNLIDNHQKQTIGLPAETAVQFTISKSW